MLAFSLIIAFWDPCSAFKVGLYCKMVTFARSLPLTGMSFFCKVEEMLLILEQ